MSIGRTYQPQAIATRNTQRELTEHLYNRDVKAASATDSASTQVKLSNLTQKVKTDDSHDINVDRIANIKAAMDAEELQLDSDKIAHVLLQNIIQLS